MEADATRPANFDDNRSGEQGHDPEVGQGAGHPSVTVYLHGKRGCT